MKHLGDITKIKGSAAPPVEVIIGGSPCQDLSVAGKRGGLQAERSGLFMEQLRVIKEMREADEQAGKTETDVRPRYMVWENVCFAAGTLITTDKGYVPIEQIKVGDRVKTLGGTYEEVAQVHITENQEVLSLHTRGSEPLTVTPNHPFYAREKTENGFTDPYWIRADCLTEKHCIGYKVDTLFAEVSGNPFLDSFHNPSNAHSVLMQTIEQEGCVKDNVFYMETAHRGTAYMIARLIRNVFLVGAEVSKSLSNVGDKQVSKYSIKANLLYGADGSFFENGIVW